MCLPCHDIVLSKEGLCLYKELKAVLEGARSYLVGRIESVWDD